MSVLKTLPLREEGLYREEGGVRIVVIIRGLRSSIVSDIFRGGSHRETAVIPAARALPLLEQTPWLAWNRQTKSRMWAGSVVRGEQMEGVKAEGGIFERGRSEGAL